MIKILFIHHAEGWGGAPNSMIKLINSLDRKEFQVQVLLLKNSIVADKLKESGIDYHIAQSKFYKKHYHYFSHSEAGYVKWYQWYKFFKLSIIWLLSRYVFAKEELAKFNPDIIHLNSSVLTDWLAPANKKAKTIIHIREPFRKGRLHFIHYFFTLQMDKYAHRIIAISQDNAKRIGLPTQTTVIYNYANIPNNDPSLNSYSSKKVLYLGGAAKIKGFYTLVEALKYLDQDIKVYFGGSYTRSKKTKNPVKQFIKWIIGYGRKKRIATQKMRSNPNAIELGMVQNVDQYLNEVCCLVSPFSTPHFARPVIEAHLHKKPAIGSNVEGMDEIIEHNASGLLFEKDNPKSLAEAINLLTRHPNKAKSMGEKGFEIAVEKFSPENIHSFKKIYYKLIND